MNKAKTLILSREDWREKYSLPGCIEAYYEDELSIIQDTLYDVIFVDRNISQTEFAALQEASKAYTVFVTDRVKSDTYINELLKQKKGKVLSSNEIQSFLSEAIENYFPENYGEKYIIRDALINDRFKGKVQWKGTQWILLEGDFGSSMTQVLYWKYNIPIKTGQCLEYYLEYETSDGVELELVITQYKAGSINEVGNQYIFSQKELSDVVYVDNQSGEGRLFAYIRAKGNGTIKIKALHDRYSRRGHGLFIPGGERYATSDGQEIFVYFDPGDMKPPLNIFFSGFKTKEGFEGYNLMKSFKSPYLLIAEARLEGGCFYMGNKEYEKLMVSVLNKYIDELGFKKSDVIMAGISMGATGALYYSADIEPHAVLLGKPLTNIGTVAANERLFRPGGFPTSLDVLAMLAGGSDKEAQDKLNRRMWRKIDHGDFSKTTFAIAYMIEDDYENQAYDDLVSHLHSVGVALYGKGLHGRHNDETTGVVSWFKQQHKTIMRNDFDR